MPRLCRHFTPVYLSYGDFGSVHHASTGCGYLVLSSTRTPEIQVFLLLLHGTAARLESLAYYCL